MLKGFIFVKLKYFIVIEIILVIWWISYILKLIMLVNKIGKFILKRDN